MAEVQPFFTVQLATQLKSAVPGTCEWAAGDAPLGVPTTLDISYPKTLGDLADYEAYRGRYLGNDPVGFGLGFRTLARTNMLHMLPQVRCPAMVVAGKHDTVRPHAGTSELAKKIPGARFELIEEAGHFMPSQGPLQLVALLESFLPK